LLASRVAVVCPSPWAISAVNDRRVTIVKIARSALDHHRGIARATECPDKERRSVRQREDDSLRKRMHTHVYTAVFIGALASKRSALDSAPELNVTCNALRFRKIRPDDEQELALVVRED
jgi:hypothetical protein